MPTRKFTNKKTTIIIVGVKDRLWSYFSGVSRKTDTSVSGECIIGYPSVVSVANLIPLRVFLAPRAYITESGSSKPFNMYNYATHVFVGHFTFP